MQRSKSSFLRDQTGFTLIEVLLALLIFGIISATIFATFAAVAKGVERGRGSADFYHVGRAAMQRMVQEIGAAFQLQAQVGDEVGESGSVPSYIQEPLKGEEELAEDGTPRDRVTFLTIPYKRFLEEKPRNELCHVCYYVADNTQGVPALFRYEDCTLEDEEDARCSGEYDPLELTDAVFGLDLTYYDAEEEYSTWPPDDTSDLLPCRVRIKLMLQRESQGVHALETTVVPLMRGICDTEEP